MRDADFCKAVERHVWLTAHVAARIVFAAPTLQSGLVALQL